MRDVMVRCQCERTASKAQHDPVLLSAKVFLLRGWIERLTIQLSKVIIPGSASLHERRINLEAGDDTHGPHPLQADVQSPSRRRFLLLQRALEGRPCNFTNTSLQKHNRSNGYLEKPARRPATVNETRRDHQEEDRLEEGGWFTKQRRRATGS